MACWRFCCLRVRRHVELEELNREKAIISVLSTIGVAISMVVVGVGLWTIGRLLGSQLSFAERFIANGLGWDSPCRYFSGIRAALYERPACASTRRDDQEPLLLAAVPA